MKEECVERYNGSWYIAHCEDCYKDNLYKNCPIIKKQEQFCIECGEKVGENNSARNCHDNCRLEL